MTPPRWMLFLLASLILFSGLSAGPGRQNGDKITFPSGYSVEGEYYDFWQSTPDALLLFGEPITNPIPHRIRDGWMVQYFQKARMEYDPSQPPGKRVSLANLGAWLYDESERGGPTDFPINNSVCREFPRTGKLVCYSFLLFYDQYDGPLYFGQPISNIEIVDGQLVQYFERARMEWRPDRPVGQRVVLTEIGWLDYYAQIGAPPSPGPDIISLVNLHTHAFVTRPLLADGDLQQIYVVVQNDLAQGIEDVTVNVTLIYPDGRKDELSAKPTNTDGYTVATKKISKLPPNQVVRVQVRAGLPGGRTTTTETWFRTWW